MTVYNLVSEYRRRYPAGHFFDAKTLRFFGERISEMYVFKKPVTVFDYRGRSRRAWVLSSLQRKAPGGPCRKYHYFDIDTFEDITML